MGLALPATQSGDTFFSKPFSGSYCAQEFVNPTRQGLWCVGSSQYPQHLTQWSAERVLRSFCDSNHREATCLLSEAQNAAAGS